MVMSIALKIRYLAAPLAKASLAVSVRMIKTSSTSPFNLLRRLARPSTALRAAWLALALLHGWLVARRIVAGEWSTPMDLARGGLCVIGVWYTWLKFWKLTTIFDAQPRRALIFALALVLGHWAVKSPTPLANFDGAPNAQWAGALAVLEVAGGVALALALIGRTRRRVVSPAPRPAAPATIRAPEPSCIAIQSLFTLPTFRRPPPCFA